jgi:TonB family protein
VKIVPVPGVVNGYERWFNRLWVASAGEGWNFLLGAVTILLAISFGWMIGRGERQTAARIAASPVRAVVSQPQTAVALESPNSIGALQQTIDNKNNAASSIDGSQIREAAPGGNGSRRNYLKSKHSVPEVTPSSPPSDDILIFEDGKQIFPVNSPLLPGINQLRYSNPPTNVASEVEDQQPTVNVSESIAEQHLLERIEPDYPESVRAAHLQGTVILNIHVGKKGTVRGLNCVTGDSQLCLLAAKAVRKWKFAPLIHNAAPASFESQITMEFALP